MVVGPDASTRAATQMVDRTVNAGSELIDRKDRIVEDVRILGVVLTTAFEGRLERMNERVEDYRRLLERRREGGAGRTPKEGAKPAPSPSASPRIQNSEPGSRPARNESVKEMER